MGREPDSLEDERTWQQPMRGPGSGRPHDQPTAAESPLQHDEASPAPEHTDPAQTSAPGEVSHLQQLPSGAGTSEHDPHRTQLHVANTSGEWDALPPPVLEVGQVVFNKYRLLEKVGEGGMGEVWRVWHIYLESERALKLIRSELAYNDKGWRRFQREARLMAKINHPNAVSVYDFRRTQSVGYIEMEFIRGRSLNVVLKDSHDEGMPLDWTTQILEQLCAVLHEAHGHVDETTGRPRPIIHRDLKPSNLMIAERKDHTGPPRLKVLDFGIAKIAEEESSPDLTGADLVGTPAYMSPEQIRGGSEKDAETREIDGRSDLYSTGVVLYHLLTGALPFRGSKMALLAAHLNNPPLPMKEANPRAVVPPEVERVVLRCLEKDPDRRPQTARELFEQFRKAADGTAAAAPVRPEAGAGRSRRTAAVAAAVVLAAGLGLVAAMIARGDRKPSIDPAGTLGVAGGSAKEPDKANPVQPQSTILWEPRGYAAVDPNDIVPDHPGFAVRLKRLDDGASFVWARDRVYLPEGYEPASLDDLLGDPGLAARAIVRKRDKARFIRISAAVYRRGDPKSGAPELDYNGKPITPHYVRVRGFYIQETEATYGEIEAYAREHPEAPGVPEWKKRLAGFRSDHPDVSRYPADSVNYTLARNYAHSVGGRLPTEAQWEWAARSCNEAFWYAWGAAPATPDEAARAHVDADLNAATFGQAPVKQYKKDQTEQHVFDLVGNLREICADPYVPYTELKLAGNAPRNPLVDERGPVDAAARDAKIVVRGGSFMRRESEATAFYRWLEPPEEIPPDVGFRVVIECPEGPERSP